MKKKLIAFSLMLILFTATSALAVEPGTIDHDKKFVEPPTWVPDTHRGAMGRTLYRLLQYKAILLSTPKLICSVYGDDLVVTVMRADFDSTFTIKLPGAKSCEVVDNELRLEIERPSPSFGQCLSKAGMGFGAGYIAGVASCAFIRK